MNVLFCVPGRSFSANWLRSWNDTVSTMIKHGYSWGISVQYDPVVYYARNRVLGGDNTLGENQTPFNGSVQYDRMLWIDSDMVWTGDDVIKLIHADEDIVSGCYPMQNNQDYPIVENLDFNLLSKQGAFKFINRNDLKNKTTKFAVSYVGFGFIAIKHGVFESMKYPWFQPRWVRHAAFVDFTSEDVSFCWTASDLGYKIYVDPNVVVGHEKSVVLF